MPALRARNHPCGGIAATPLIPRTQHVPGRVGRVALMTWHAVCIILQPDAIRCSQMQPEQGVVCAKPFPAKLMAGNRPMPHRHQGLSVHSRSVSAAMEHRTKHRLTVQNRSAYHAVPGELPGNPWAQPATWGARWVLHGPHTAHRPATGMPGYTTPHPFPGAGQSACTASPRSNLLPRPAKRHRAGRYSPAIGARNGAFGAARLLAAPAHSPSKWASPARSRDEVLLPRTTYAVKSSHPFPPARGRRSRCCGAVRAMSQ